MYRPYTKKPRIHGGVSRVLQGRLCIAGHTGAVGSDASNLESSKQRAKAASDYLAQSNSIAPSRLEMEGFGRSLSRDSG